MEDDTEDSTVQGSEDRNRVDKLNSLKNKKKGVRKKKVIDAHCEDNINTVAEELVSSKNIAS